MPGKIVEVDGSCGGIQVSMKKCETNFAFPFVTEDESQLQQGQALRCMSTLGHSNSLIHWEGAQVNNSADQMV